VTAFRSSKTYIRAAILAVALGAGSVASAAFTITLNFTGGLTPSEEAIFSSAKATWESYITGYRPGINLTGLTIDASGAAIDGVGGTLGQAGPDTVEYFLGRSLLMPTHGTMQFDTADMSAMVANGTFNSVILHEMAHVIGFGTLWTYDGVYTTGSGHYTGPAALAAYRIEFNQPSATYVPVELTGDPRTADGHWAEVTGGAGATGIVDRQGRDMEYELMTGWLNAPAFISNTTVQSFADIGYAVPEPGILFTLFGGSTILMLRKRQRKAA
jgi:hypothetical protein